MHLRKLILVCGLLCALLSNVVAALGLGEVRLNSKLNEPLSAEITLLDTQGLSADQIIVGLASPADFERNGVDRIFFLTEFEFEVLLNRAGGPIVSVTSRNPVREPFVNFLVEARWPTGRLLREYTLLMDLPTFSDRRSAAVETPATQSAPAPRSVPSRRSSESATPAASPLPRSGMASGASGEGNYAVGDNDTLWQIALEIRPDNSHSVHQTMLAIQRVNPDAFINGNINLLRKGQVLRIPSGDEIQAVSQREAVNEVARQNQAWSDDSMGAQLSASRRDTSARRDSGAVSGSVKLATPGGADTTSGQGSGENSGRGRALEAELAASLEELDKTRSENQELSSRVRDLEEQIRTMERLVEVSNEQLRALQLNAAQDNDPAADVDDGYTQAPAADQDLESPQAQPSAVEEDAPATAEEAAPASNVAATTPSRTVVAPQASPSLLDSLRDYLLWIIAGIILLVLLVVLAVYRRRQQTEQQDVENDDDIFAMDAEAPQEGTYDEEATLFPENAPDTLAIDEEELPAEAETGDVVGEADIYIAYGKFDQAEEMLLNALAKDPDSIDIRLKLLEVYSQTQDAHKFDHYYTGLIGLAGQPALARAAELREHIDGAGEFVPVEGAGGVDLSTTDDAIDLADQETTFDSDEFALDDDLELNLSDEPAPLADDGAVTEEDIFSLGNNSFAEEISTGSARYDLSFEESEADTPSASDDVGFDFDLENDLEVSDAADHTVTTSAVGERAPEDDEFAFELDEPEPESPEPQPQVLLEEDEFEFDFEEDNVAPISAPSMDESAQPAADAPLHQEALEEELPLPEDDSDEFNLDMEMDDLDLAALDEEMKDLEADFADADIELEEESETSFTLDEGDSVELEELADPATATPEPDFDDLEIGAAEEVPVIEDRIDEDDVFEEALSGFAAPDADLNDVSDEDMDAELDFLADADEAATKLDLARAYIDMGDTEGARDILTEVTHEGNEQQRQEAEELLSRIDA